MILCSTPGLFPLRLRPLAMPRGAKTVSVCEETCTHGCWEIEELMAGCVFFTPARFITLLRYLSSSSKQLDHKHCPYLLTSCVLQILQDCELFFIGICYVGC